MCANFLDHPVSRLYLCAGALRPTYLLTYTVFGSVLCVMRIKPSISPKQLKIEWK